MFLGWDIGIKNLAYCKLKPVNTETLEISTTNEHIFTLGEKSFILEDWNTINITEQVENNNIDNGTITLSKLKSKCNVIKPISKSKSKSKCNLNIQETQLQPIICNRNATFITEDGLTLMCNKHYTSSIENDKINDIVKTYIPVTTEPKCESLIYSKKEKSIVKCSKKSTCVLASNNYIGYCDKHKPNGNILIINKKINAQQISLTKLGVALYQQLDLINDVIFQDVEVVLLENQPVLKNPTMKSVQMFLYSYFVLRGMVDNKSIRKIKCYMASKKTELSKYLTQEQQDEIINEMKDVKDSYKVNKKTSIFIVNYILENNNIPSSKWLDFFKSHSKKDDLADAFLMTLHYLLKKQ
jgi:hypothetical protein